MLSFILIQSLIFKRLKLLNISVDLGLVNVSTLLENIIKRNSNFYQSIY